MRKLLFVVSEDWYFVTHRLTLAEAAIAEGWQVTVATRVGAHGDRIRDAGCTLVDFTIGRGIGTPWGEWATLWRLYRLYRRERPSIVHQVALKPVVYGTCAAILARVPGIVNAIVGLGFAFSSTTWRARIIRPVLKMLLRVCLRAGAQVVIVQNPDDEKALRRLGIGRDRNDLVLIRGAGVDLALYHPQPPPPGIPIVLMATRMLWDKGVGEFVNAARECRATGVAARFVLVGGPDAGNPGSVPEEQLRAWADTGAIEWWGHQPEMPAVLSKASVVTLPSFYGEGIPKVLLEAAAAGRPIVTTNAPGCREVVTDGVEGRLVPMRDVGALAEAFRSLLEHENLRCRMGAAARQRAEREFGLAGVIAQTLQCYHRLAERVLAQDRVVIWVVTEDWFVVSHWLPILRALVQSGWRVVVATRVYLDADAIRATGAELVPIGLARSSLSPWVEIRSIWELVRLYRRVSPTVVHHVALKPVLYGSIAAVLSGVPETINALTGLGYAFSRAGVRGRALEQVVARALSWALNRSSATTLFENPDDIAFFRGRGIVRGPKVALWPGAGVDVHRFRELAGPEQPPMVMLPARMLWDKGVGEFVAAARIMRREGRVIRFALVGGEDRANPSAIPVSQLNQWVREGVVEWLGHREDMPQLLSAATIVCLPSYREGLPKALSEAAACGRPIIACDVPGCREVVVHGKNGLLIPPRDAKALRAAIDELLADGSRREQMGIASRAIAENKLSIERVVAEVHKTYAGLADAAA